MYIIEYEFCVLTNFTVRFTGYCIRLPYYLTVCSLICRIFEIQCFMIVIRTYYKEFKIIKKELSHFPGTLYNVPENGVNSYGALTKWYR